MARLGIVYLIVLFQSTVGYVEGTVKGFIYYLPDECTLYSDFTVVVSKSHFYLSFLDNFHKSIQPEVREYGEMSTWREHHGQVYAY